MKKNASPTQPHARPVSHAFSRLASYTSTQAGKPHAFLLACLIIVVWAVTGPIFNYSDTWQLVINTGTTIITFLMVFVIQNSQNRDGVAIQTKLDELIRAGQGENKFVGIEHLTEEEIEELRIKCEQRSVQELRKTFGKLKDARH